MACSLTPLRTEIPAQHLNWLHLVHKLDMAHQYPVLQFWFIGYEAQYRVHWREIHTFLLVTKYRGL